MTAPRCVVLVVDDEKAIIILLQEALALMGYDVIVADSGDAALPIVASGAAIDVILTDVVMPGKANGFDLIEQAKVLRPGIHTIAMSGYVAKHGDRIGLADRFIQKPFTIPVIDRALQSLMLRQCA
ncbi:response regulator [Sphingomonas sp. CFBP 8760]|uniref:response regulator n=1 Tax=Sphingomonas sp. CFBP 8760 TaxID=2775282 RepID=UPI00177FB012|nr:response regulator [Sphingomonas sp. CFBP 8760]MBD8547184.1 response regulator [Sphingomonas sp. CFBP 8760]